MALEDKVYVCSECGCHHLFKPNTPPLYNTCHCGGNLIPTNVTAEEMFLIRRTSEDPDFINAMIELKKNDIIEYQTRISQFRSQAKVDGCYGKPKQDDNKPKCPTCGSVNIRKIGAGERAMSVMGFGLLSKKINKTWKCENCGHTW